MDDLDKKLINALSHNGRLSITHLAQKLDIARATVQYRLDRLEESGIIAGYTIRLADQAFIHHIRAMVLVKLDPQHQDKVIAYLRKLPVIERLYTTSGRFDIFLELLCEHTEHLDSLLDEIGALTGVRSSESLITLSDKLKILQNKK